VLVSSRFIRQMSAHTNSSEKELVTGQRESELLQILELVEGLSRPANCGGY
jgi:hypothetical protein